MFEESEIQENNHISVLSPKDPFFKYFKDIDEAILAFNEGELGHENNKDQDPFSEYTTLHLDPFPTPILSFTEAPAPSSSFSISSGDSYPYNNNASASESIFKPTSHKRKRNKDKSCEYCSTNETSQWRRHPKDKNTIVCNACYYPLKRGKRMPETRPKGFIKRNGEKKPRERIVRMENNELSCASCKQTITRDNGGCRVIPIEFFKDPSSRDLINDVWCKRCYSHFI